MPEYKPIVGFPDYRVGSDGSIWSSRKRGGHGGSSTAWRRAKTFIKRNGYVSAVLYANVGEPKHLLVHRIVLTAFVGECPEGMECRHKNGIKLDNSSSNLEWGTRKENIGDKKKHGTYLYGSMVKSSKLDDSKVSQIKQRFSAGLASLSELSKENNVSYSLISKIILNKAWKHVKV
jgi:hypothetical protein